MSKIVCFSLGLLFGGGIGTIVMCCLTSNRPNKKF